MTMVSLSRLTKQKDESSPKETVLLITPPSAFLLDERVFMSLGILKVAASLEQRGYPVEFLDLSGIENFVEVAGIQATQTEARTVAITATTPQLPFTIKIVQKIREVNPGLRIVLGGPHATLVHSAMKLEQKRSMVGRAHKAMAALESVFDTIVSGDGESSIFEAIRPDAPKVIDADLPKGGLFMTNEDYEASPPPARHLVDVESYKYTIEGHKATSLIAQLGCPFMCSFSLTGDTLISTDRGFERLDSLIHGDCVDEYCEHGGHVQVYEVDRNIATLDGWSKDVKIVDEGTRPVFEVSIENGTKVKATAEHPFLVVSGDQTVWKNTEDLKIGDYIVMKSPVREWPVDFLLLQTPNDFPIIPSGGFERKAHHRTPSSLSPDIAWLAGFIVGDGCLPKDRRPSIHVCVTPEVREKLIRVVKENFNVDLAINPSSHTEKMEHGWIHSRLVYSFFSDIIGINPDDKFHVPGIILRSPKVVLQAFLDGLFEADGYEYTPGREYLTTVSETLAIEVANSYLLLGDVGNIQEILKEDGKTIYRVFKRVLDRIPTSKAIYKSSKSGKYYWRTFRSKKNVGVYRKTLRDSGLSHPLDIDNHFYLRVEKIKLFGSDRIYDLRVPGSHSFIANGIVSHNCGGRNSNMLRRIRTRSTSSIVQEIEHLYNTYGFTGFNFFDDELNVSKTVIELMDSITDLQERLGVEFRLRGFIKAELFNEAQARSMYRAGFRWLLCGFEAANPRILENIQKKAKIEDNDRVMEIASKFSFKVKALMSVGHAGESEETIMGVRDWLLRVKPADFDCTVISCFPGTPYYDEAVPHESVADAWTYTSKKSGDRLHSYDIDYSTHSDYYKGDPNDGYKSFVFTDHLSGSEIVRLRNLVESEVREKLNIPFNPGQPGVRHEHSMGQSQLPFNILRKSTLLISRFSIATILYGDVAR